MSTCKQPAITQYALFRYALYARQLRKFCYAFYMLAVYVRCGAVLGQRGN